MSHLMINIDLDNAAFDDKYPGNEVSRILHRLGESMEYESLEDFGTKPLLDLSGNKVGEVIVYMDPKPDPDEAQRERRDKEYRRFVDQMSREDIMVTLVNACDIQVFDNETRRQLVETLVASLHDGDTDLDSLRHFFQGKYA